jgi:hypothetical protein
MHFIETTQNNVMLCYIIYSNLWSGCGGVVKGAVLKAKEIGAAVCQWGEFESDRWKKKKLTAQRSNSSTVCRWKNKNLTALKSNSNTFWFNFQTYSVSSDIYIYIYNVYNVCRWYIYT